jgi:hypothetical protein
LKLAKEPRRLYLSGLIWDIYLYILTSGEPVGVREVWRALRLSSPSLAQYHINNLLRNNLISQTSEGRYIAEEKARVEVLRNFVFLGGRLISRLVFYGAFIFGLLLVYLFSWTIEWTFQDIFVLAVCVFSMLIFSFEAYSQHRGLRKGIQKV